MTSIRLASLRLAAAALALAAAQASADPVKIRAALEKSMPDVKIGAITKTSYAGLWEVVANGTELFYTDAKGEIAFIGRVVNIATRENLSERRLEDLRRIDFAKLPLDRAIVKVKGKGTRKLAVFSDPDCPYCKQLEPELAKIDDVTIYTFLFPIPQLHPDAMRKATLVWCAKDRAGAWDDLMLRGKVPAESSLSCATPIVEIQQLATTIGIQGTPGLVFSDGNVVSEALSAKEVEERLARAAKFRAPKS